MDIVTHSLFRFFMLVPMVPLVTFVACVQFFVCLVWHTLAPFGDVVEGGDDGGKDDDGEAACCTGGALPPQIKPCETGTCVEGDVCCICMECMCGAVSVHKHEGCGVAAPGVRACGRGKEEEEEEEEEEGGPAAKVEVCEHVHSGAEEGEEGGAARQNVEERAVYLPCSEAHRFHEKCILQWLAVRDTCPLCTAPVGANLDKPQRPAEEAPPPANRFSAHPLGTLIGGVITVHSSGAWGVPFILIEEGWADQWTIFPYAP